MRKIVLLVLTTVFLVGCGGRNNPLVGTKWENTQDCEGIKAIYFASNSEIEITFSPPLGSGIDGDWITGTAAYVYKESGVRVYLDDGDFFAGKLIATYNNTMRLFPYYPENLDEFLTFVRVQ